MGQLEVWQERYGSDPDAWFFGKEPSALGRLTERFWSVCHGEQTARALDLGCGEGRDTVFFARRGHAVTAMDLSPAGIEKAGRLAAEAGVVLQGLHCGNIADFPLTGEHNLVFAGNSLGGLGTACLRTLRRIQRATPRRGLNAIRVSTREAWGLEDLPDHYRFDRNELKHEYRSWRLLYHAEDLLYVPHMDRLTSFADIIAQKL